MESKEPGRNEKYKTNKQTTRTTVEQTQSFVPARQALYIWVMVPAQENYFEKKVEESIWLQALLSQYLYKNSQECMKLFME